MKKHFPVLLLATVLFSAGAHAAGDVVYMDTQEVFKSFYKTQLAQNQIRQQADDIKLERESMEADLKDLQEEVEALRIDARDEALSEELRASKREQLEEKLVERQKIEKETIEFEKLRMQQLEQQNTRMSRKLFDEIREAVIIYSKEKGFSGVIDRSAQSRNGMQMILYSDPKKDITAEVIVVLNEGHEELLTEEPVDETE